MTRLCLAGQKNMYHLVMFPQDFCRQLVTFCNIKPHLNSHTNTYRLADCGELKQLRRLLKENDWMHPVLPFRAFMSPTLPTGEYTTDHEPFITNLPTMAEFKEDFIVMSSLQKPKCVGIIDSFGEVIPRSIDRSID